MDARPSSESANPLVELERECLCPRLKLLRNELLENSGKSAFLAHPLLGDDAWMSCGGPALTGIPRGSAPVSMSVEDILLARHDGHRL